MNLKNLNTKNIMTKFKQLIPKLEFIQRRFRLAFWLNFIIQSKLFHLLYTTMLFCQTSITPSAVTSQVQRQFRNFIVYHIKLRKILTHFVNNWAKNEFISQFEKEINLKINSMLTCKINLFKNLFIHRV